MSEHPERPSSLRREIVKGYSVVLLVSLTLFAGATYVILAQTLSRAGTASLRETAQAAEQIIVPPNVERVAVEEMPLPPGHGSVEALRRRTHLATGDVVDIVVARTGDVEHRATNLFALIALLLIPVTAAAAAFAGRSVANRILDPLSRLVAASREIGIGGLSRRVEEPARPAELRELASSFNGMLERLQRAVEALRRFTADASHELRTPLTAIRGTAEVALARDRSPEELRDTLGEVLDETRSMLALVEDLLALARGEEGAAGPLGPVDLVPLLHEVAEIGEALADGRPVRVRLELPPSAVVRGIAGPLRRLFLNLVSNAVKFTERGEVVIAVRDEAALPVPAGIHNGAADTPDAPGWVAVEIRDTGGGIAAHELPRVFDRFYRADAARERSGGTGLGLAIGRMIAEQHGGTIDAESVPGTGSVFRVRLPRAGVSAD
ncbi:MAG: cusS 2 [Gemmatimonadetes bacterium]|nr:cusS 2 [Gemmatimonadota bacterium]